MTPIGRRNNTPALELSSQKAPQSSALSVLSGGLTEFLDHPSVEELSIRLDLALEGANLGIWDWDLRDNSVHFDRRWCEMIGMKFDETPQLLSTWESRVHPEDLAKCYQAIEAYLKGATPYYESVHRMRHVEGHWVYILDRGRISGWDPTGKAIRFTGTHFDVTSVEEAKILLEQERDLFRNLVSSLPHSVAMLGLDLTYLAVSAGWLEGSRLSSVNILGRPFCEVKDSFPLFQLKEDWREMFEKVLKGGSFSRERSSFIDGEGRTRSFRWWLRPWRKTSGTVGGVLVLMEEVTDLVQAELRAQFSAKMASLGEMAGSVAHEINTPLAIISVMSGQISEILEDLQSRGVLPKDSKGDVEQLFQNASLIESTVLRISKIIRSMRTFSRDSSEDAKLQASLDGILEDTFSLCAERFRHSGVQLHLEGEPHRYLLLCRPGELSQVFINLLNNAWDAVNALPRASECEKWIRVRVEALDEGRVRICFEDSGVPVTEEAKQKMFQPFFTTKPLGQGTGLGLPLSLRIVQAHGGRLFWEEPSPVKRFVVELPVVQSRIG